MSETSNKRGVVVQFKSRRVRRVQGSRIGVLVGHDERGPIVDYPGNPHGELVARSTVPLEASAIERGKAPSCEVLLVFADEQSNEPIIVGLLRPAPVTPQAPAESAAPAIALVDGRRVVIEATDEIVLRSGKASITLRRNGRVVVRGTHVETDSNGVNRIKGGSVRIN